MTNADHLGIRVTVEDLKTGQKQAMHIAPGDMVLIPVEPCFKAHVSRYEGTGTTVITLKDHRPQWPAKVVNP